MALMMVAQGLTPADVARPGAASRLPRHRSSQMLHGDLGQPPGGWPPALQKKVLKGETPITVRPGSLLADADLDAERKSRRREALRPRARRRRARLLPHVSEGVHRFRRAPSASTARSSVLPTPVFFYGMAVGEEVPSRSSAARRWSCGSQAIGETDEDGQVRVFFELNGQPRMRQGAEPLGRRSVGRRPQGRGGQRRPCRRAHARRRLDHRRQRRPDGQAGDVLLTIEAMKMETTLRASQNGVVKEVLARIGKSIDAKDLLVIVGR